MDSRVVRIVNLDDQTTELSLKDFIQNYVRPVGRVENVFVRNNENLVLVFAFVTFEHYTDARLVVQKLNGFYYNTLFLEVELIGPNLPYTRHETNKNPSGCIEVERKNENLMDYLRSTTMKSIKSHYIPPAKRRPNTLKSQTDRRRNIETKVLHPNTNSNNPVAVIQGLNSNSYSSPFNVMNSTTATNVMIPKTNTTNPVRVVQKPHSLYTTTSTSERSEASSPVSQKPSSLPHTSRQISTSTAGSPHSKANSPHSTANSVSRKPNVYSGITPIPASTPSNVRPLSNPKSSLCYTPRITSTAVANSSLSTAHSPHSTANSVSHKLNVHSGITPIPASTPSNVRPLSNPKSSLSYTPRVTSTSVANSSLSTAHSPHSIANSVSRNTNVYPKVTPSTNTNVRPLADNYVSQNWNLNYSPQSSGLSTSAQISVRSTVPSYYESPAPVRQAPTFSSSSRPPSSMSYGSSFNSGINRSYEPVPKEKKSQCTIS